ncbi:aminotransferase class V-fold PLP-dependent enzyme [Ornithinimicrobium sp. INDO-MA30-4]|uniref:aminotransferase class V-fold PLP-dependent enzyme n=1 Tax=Ornithinimicrobium sp. INDO-MA30-4 TaxID=2908651 RepID=UPI001F31ACA1|nr:aminotransferase class V-fold PLP-dependent enzyme [Ornithinimicrobium sp. INDO-MA30-4]UJH71380.1 aminotransferase class V-fold PLP-dependent enzyme [Ornithinimicrobium sp. INDO-MA30-4]
MTALHTLQRSFAATTGYLNASTVGLPPIPVVSAMSDLMSQWQRGDTDPVALGADVEASRAAYARMVKVPASAVSVGSMTSVFAGTIATSLPPNAEVVVIAEDFTSMIFPFLVQQDTGLQVRQVPRADLAEAIRPSTDLVVFSLAQSACGSLVDLEAVLGAARDCDAMTLCDTTQAAGWLPIEASLFDITVCSAYKWLCQPRGTAYMTISPRASDLLRPNNAGWYAGESVWDSVYGPEMDLATDARRFDVSPAWFCWSAGLVAMELFAQVPTQAIRDHDVSLANEFRSRIGQAPGVTPVVTLADPGADLVRAFEAAGGKISSRAGCARIAFHVWNSLADVDLAVEAVAHSKVTGRA